MGNSIRNKTKLSMPKTGQFTIVRSRLNQKLNGCVRRKLTLVLAPSGYGKTTAVLQWVESSGFPCAWFTADSGDNDPTAFWRNLCTSLDSILPGILCETESAVNSQELLAANAQITSVIDRAAELRCDCVVVIDDMQFIHNQTIYGGLAYLIDFLPPRLHLVLIGKAEPEHGLAGYELKSQLLRVGVRDLRFLKGEIADFFKIRDLAIDSQDVINLEKYTEGWAAALVAAAMSMEKGLNLNEAMTMPDGCSRSIDQYFMDEILSSWTEEKRKFAVETSVLKVMNAALCDRVTGGKNGGRLLGEMSWRNEFLIPLDNRNFRYHNLFKEFLYKLLLKEQPDSVTDLHIRAAAWYKEQEMCAEAIEHYLDGLSYNEAYALIERQLGELTMTGAFETGISWVIRLPESFSNASPKIAAFYAIYYAEFGHFELSREWIEKAVKMLKAMDDDETKKETRNIVNLVWTYLLLKQGKTEELLELTRNLEPDVHNQRKLSKYYDFNRADPYFYRCPVGALVNSVASSKEDLITLTRCYRKIILKEPGYTSLAIGEYYYESDHLDEAVPYLTKALENARSAQCAGVLVPVMIDIARIKKARGDLAGAFKTLEECESGLRAFNKAHWISLVQAFGMRLHMETGSVKTAEKWAGACKLGIFSEITRFNEFELIVYARYLIKRKRLDDACLLLLRLLNFADTEARQHSRVEILNLLAILSYRKDSLPLSLSYMEQSLSAGLFEGYIRSYVDEGKALLELLEQVTGASSVNGCSEEGAAAFAISLAERIRSEIGAYSKSNGIAAGDRIRRQLTARELEVLTLLYGADNNVEICKKLNISMRTVKTHTGNIYAKLGVANRIQCIRLVQEAGVFDTV